MKLATMAGTEVVRPLKVLVPLIQGELDAGDKVGIEHYRRAGEMLLEAKKQVGHGEWVGWLRRNFQHRSNKTVSEYMRLALAVKSEPGRRFANISEATRPGRYSGPAWQAPVQDIASRVNVEALAKEQQNREREAALLRTLALQLIAIGYKVLSAKLHPDKSGGSSEAMARLNKVRSILKEAS